MLKASAEHFTNRAGPQAVTLVFAGVLALNSVLVLVLPFAGVAYGLLMAKLAPFGKRGAATP